MAVTGSMSIQVPREVLGGGVAVWYYVIIFVSIDYLCIYVPYIYDYDIYIYSIKMDGLMIWDLKPLKNTLIFFLKQHVEMGRA